MKHSKKIMIVVGIVAFAVISFGLYVFYQYKTVCVYDEELKPYCITKQKGKLGVVIWNSYCASCVYSLKDYAYLKKYFEINDAQLVFVLISDSPFLRNGAKAHFVRQNLRELSSYFDKDSKFCALYEINSTPTLLLFDNGKLIKKIEGSRTWKNPEDMKIINDFLDI